MATRPVYRTNKPGWLDSHSDFSRKATYSQSSLILTGDSIVKGLSRYKNFWQIYFEPYETLNFGISGDKTQHVLWRVMNMNLPDSLKNVIVHCGTNNVGKDGPVDIVNALLLIATHIQKRKPGVKYLYQVFHQKTNFHQKPTIS